MNQRLPHSLFWGECNPFLSDGIEYCRALVALHFTYLAIFVVQRPPVTQSRSMPYSDKPLEILSQIRTDQKPFPIYILMGEEEYFTDKIEKKIVSTYMPDEGERDFNHSVLYGSSCTIEDIIATCRRYPMGGERTIVVVREAQGLITASTSESGSGQPLAGLTQLLSHPNPFNILVVCIKGGKKLNRRMAFVKELERGGVLVESKEIRDYQITPYIQPIAAEHGLQLSMQAQDMVAQRIGTDLTRLDSEMEKLSTALVAEARQMVTPEMVLEYTGWNKEFSVFDLRKALAYGQRGEAMKVVMALAADEKKTPVQMILPQLFSYFANLLIAFYATDRQSEQSVMKQLGISNRFFVQEYMAGLRHYKASKVLNIIKYIRKCDARSKGMYSDEGSGEEILVDLVLFIMS